MACIRKDESFCFLLWVNLARDLWGGGLARPGGALISGLAPLLSVALMRHERRPELSQMLG